MSTDAPAAATNAAATAATEAMPGATAPPVEPWDVREPDPRDPDDGINDKENIDVERFLSIVGTGNPELKMPGPDDEAWPPLPDGVRDVRGSYFRKADFSVSAGGGDESYEELLAQHMARLGLARGGGSRVGHALGTVLCSLTGIGACFVCKRTRRLNPGEVAFFHDRDHQPHFVGGGWSLETNPFHSGFERFRTDQDYICYNNIVHVVRVRPGYYARAVLNGHPALLEAGENNEVGVHILVEPNFRLLGGGDVHAAMVRKDADHIDASPFHIINVPPERVVSIEIDRKPHVLFSGRHVLESSTLTIREQQGFHLTKPFSVAGILHYYIVYPGQLGCVKLDQQACFIDRPLHLWFYSPHVETMKLRPLEEEKVSFASLTRLIVDDYRVGLIRNKSGQLVVLRPGVHVVKRPVVHLGTFSTEWHHCREDITAITADPLDIKLTMTMSYRIQNVCSFFKAGDPDQTHRDVREMAKSTMSEIVRSMRFEETLRRYGKSDTGRETHVEEQMERKSAEPPAEGEDDDDEAAPVELIRNQWQSVSQAYTNRFALFLRETFGIQLDESVWGYQNFDLVDQRHQESLTKAVYARSEARAERVRLDLTKETAVVRRENAKIEAELQQFQAKLAAETKREVDLIEVQARQEVRNAEVEAEYARKEKQREIEIADAKAKADADFYETQRRADAEAYAITAKAEAARKLYEDAPQEFELELQRIQAQTVANMKPQVFLGDAGGASLQKALALMVSRMSGSMAADGAVERQRME